MTKEQSYLKSKDIFDILTWVPQEEYSEIIERALRWLQETKDHQQTLPYHDGRYK